MFAGREPSNRGLLFVPLVFRLAAAIDQLSWEELTADPATTAATLRNAAATFRADAVINWFDTWSELGVLGAALERDSRGNVVSCSGLPPKATQSGAILKSVLQPKLVDIARRLCKERRPGTLVAGFLTGFKTVATRLRTGWGDGSPQSGLDARREEELAALQTAFQWGLNLARCYFEEAVDFLLVAEEQDGVGAFYSEHAKLLRPVVNLAHHYRRPIVVLSRRPIEPKERALTAAAGFDSVSADGRLITFTAGLAGAGRIRLIPEAIFEAPHADWEVAFKEQSSLRAGEDRVVMSSWEVPPGTMPERLVELAERLKQ